MECLLRYLDKDTAVLACPDWAIELKEDINAKGCSYTVYSHEEPSSGAECVLFVVFDDGRLMHVASWSDLNEPSGLDAMIEKGRQLILADSKRAG
jgi:hypothetical protein